MKVIFNSDVLYHTHLVRDQMSSPFEELFKFVAANKHTIVIPETTRLEFAKQQKDHAEREKEELEKAYAVLRRSRVEYKELKPGDLINEPNLVELIRSRGVNVVVEEPTLEDFREAHRRACVHESPHPLKAESDEMRDLIIWVMACRIAAADGGALLVSRDKVHTGHLGNEEATKVKLVRAESVEEVLEFFELLTPAADAIMKMIAPAWNDLVSAGLPFGPSPSITGLSKARFVQGNRGPILAKCHMNARTNQNELLRARVEIALQDQIIREITVSEITVNDEPWRQHSVVAQPNKPIAVEVDDYQDRLSALRATLGVSK